MPFEHVRVRLPDGQEHGPVPWDALRQWVQQGRVPPDATLLCQATFQGRSVRSFPELMQALPAGPAGDETTATIIPYRNMPALVGYYLGVFSLSACIPILGLVGVGMGIAAIVLGIKGLRNVRANPAAKGTVHAWIAIVCGSIFAVVGLLINALTIAAIVADATRP